MMYSEWEMLIASGWCGVSIGCYAILLSQLSVTVSSVARFELAIDDSASEGREGKDDNMNSNVREMRVACVADECLELRMMCCTARCSLTRWRR